MRKPKPKAAKPPDLTQITETPPTGDNPDSETKKEQEDLAAQEKKALLQSLTQDISERKKYAGRIFCLLSAWLSGIFLLLILQGMRYNGFQLADSVLIAAIGGTTVNVIGIFIVVTRYLFPSSATSGRR